jgi:capsid protein
VRIGPFTVQRTRPVNRRAYDAARVSRLTSDWIFSHQSADREVRAGLEKIRQRARDLERNSDYARRYLSLVESNIVGKAGFSLRLAVPEQLAANGAALVGGWMARPRPAIRTRMSGKIAAISALPTLGALLRSA